MKPPHEPGRMIVVDDNRVVRDAVTALVGEKESATFDIDNTPPRIETQPPARAGVRTTISFVVRDEQSAVQRVECAGGTEPLEVEVRGEVRLRISFP